MRRITPPALPALVLALLLAFGALARAQTPNSLTLTSISRTGVSSTVSYTPTTGRFDASIRGGLVHVDYDGEYPNYGYQELDFAGLYNGPLHPGEYADATAESYKPTPRPVLTVGDYNQTGAVGSFTIHKIVYGGGQVLSFWATFEQTGRPSEDAETVRGEIRYNVDATAESANQRPAVYAGEDVRVALADGAQLVGGVSDDDAPAPAAISTTWSVVSGPGTVTFSAPTALATDANFSAPGKYTLRLKASDGQLIGQDDVEVAVIDTAQMATIHLEGEGNAPVIGKAGVVDVDELAGDIEIGKYTDRRGVFVKFTSAPYYTFRFEQPAFEKLPLVRGVYATGSSGPAGGPGRGVMTLYSSISGGGDVGSFEVKKLAFSADGRVSALWITFQQEYGYSIGTVRGEIRFHADSTDPGVNQAPGAFAGTDARIFLADAVSVSGLSADDGLPAGALIHTWSVARGPGTAVFEDAHGLQTTARFSAPGDYTLRLTADDGELQATDEVRVVVVDPAAATSLDLQREPGWQDTSYSRHIVPIDADFTITEGVNNELLVVVSQRTGNEGDQWTMLFEAAQKERIEVGSYFKADALSLSNDPYLDVRLYDSQTHTDSGGGFEVLKLIRGDDGAILSLWMVFRTTHGFRGELKYHAEMIPPGPTIAPGVSAGFELHGPVGTPLPLSGVVADNDGPASAPAVQWTLVSGPGAAHFQNPLELNTTATFSKPGEYVLKLTATDGALSRESLLHVRATGPNDPSRLRLITDPDGVKAFDWSNSIFSVKPDEVNGLSIEVEERGSAAKYLLSVRGPKGRLLAPRQYGGAGSSLTIDGGGLYGEAQTAQFTIRQLAYAADGSVAKLWLTFNLRQRGRLQPIRGDLRLNADAPNDLPKLMANAGPDQTVPYYSGAKLQARALLASGAPFPAPVSVSWRVVEGLGATGATFDNRYSLTPTVRFPAAGVYELEVTLATFTDVASERVIVVATPFAQPPVQRFFDSSLYDGSGQAGAIELRLTASGYYSAKLYLRGKTYGLSGFLTSDPIAVPGTPITIAFRFYAPDDARITVAEGDRRYENALIPTGIGRLGEFPKEVIGAYNFTGSHYFNPNAPDAAAVLGSAWGTVTVTPKGFAIATFHLPDGRVVTTSSRLTPDGSTFLNYRSPDGKCVLVGILDFYPDSIYSNVYGEIDWTRRGRSLVTPGPLEFTRGLSVSGEPRVRLTPEQEPLHLTTDSVKAILYFTDDGKKYLRVPVTIDGWSSTPRGTGDTTASIAFDAFGQFTGTFVDPGTKKTIPFQGIAEPGAGRGEGYYYLQGKSGHVGVYFDREPQEP